MVSGKAASLCDGRANVGERSVRAGRRGGTAQAIAAAAGGTPGYALTPAAAPGGASAAAGRSEIPTQPCPRRDSGSAGILQAWADWRLPGLLPTVLIQNEERTA